MPAESNKAIIVGGGIAGLLAAIELARSGVKVTLFEAAADLGGRARTKNADGYLLNQGPHALYIKGEFRRELQRLGIPFHGQRSSPEPQGLYQGRLYRFPTSLASLAFCNLFGAADKLGFARAQKAVIDGTTGKESFGVWLDGQDLSPLVRAAMEGIGRVSSYSNAPSSMLASAMLEQMRRGGKGVLYLDGGWASLVAGLSKAATDAGADIVTGDAVERIAVEGRRTRIVLADGSEHVADAALLAMGPKEAVALAPQVASLGQYSEEAIPIRANALDLALSKMPERAKAFAFGIDQPFYFSVHSTAAKLAPDGGAVVHIAKYLAIDEKPGRDAIAELEAVADLAMPGWRLMEKRRQEMLGMTVSHALVRWDRKRPDVELHDAPGLFIAGDWVGGEGMLSDASAASAITAADAMKAWLASGGVSRSAA